MLFLLELYSTLSDEIIFVTSFPFLTDSVKPPNFQLNVLGDSISINKLCYNSSEKIDKTSKIAILGPNLHKKAVNMDHAQLSENFCFIKMSHILAE